MSDDKTAPITAEEVDLLIAFLDSDPFHNLPGLVVEAIQQCGLEISAGLQRFCEGIEYAVLYIEDARERNS